MGYVPAEGTLLICAKKAEPRCAISFGAEIGKGNRVKHIVGPSVTPRPKVRRAPCDVLNRHCWILRKPKDLILAVVFVWRTAICPKMGKDRKNCCALLLSGAKSK
jgi:hypothetical protein